MQDEFVAFSGDYVLFAHITTRVETDKYQDLLDQKGGDAFPYIVYMDGGGNVIAKLEASRTIEGFSETGRKAKSFMSVQARAEAGDEDARREYVLLRLELGILAIGKGEEELGELSKEERARVDAVKANAAVRRVLRDMKDAVRARKTFYGWVKEGRPGPNGVREKYYYFTMVLDEAQERGDADTFEKALRPLKEAFGRNPSAEGFFKDMEERLRKLRAAGKE